MIPQPNLFILGPPRTGTTSLSRWLSATPSVTVCRPKEPAYHAVDLPMVDRIHDYDEYLALFAGSEGDRYRCDATPWYLYSAKAPASIHDMAPEARLIIRLRNPVDMLASLHTHHRYVGLESETDFERAVFANRHPDPSDFRSQLDYLDVARVGEQAKRYLDTFSREQILFCRSRVASRNPARAHVEVLEWLGLDPVPLESYERLNQSRRPVVGSLRPVTEWMIQSDKPRPLRAIGYRVRNANTKAARTTVSAKVRRRILHELRDDLELLAEVSGLNVISWWS